MAFHDSNDQFDPAAYVQLVVEALQVRVDRVTGNVQFLGDLILVSVVEDALDDLEFAFGKRQPLANLKPDLWAEETSPSLAIPIFVDCRHLASPRCK